MRKIINIHIGECHASNEPAIISTVLGSCIAVCMFDPIRKIGGMNHILLPGTANLGDYNNPTRFGMNAMELLINSMMKVGAKRSYLSAKVFGGARVLTVLSEENQVGLKNAEFVINYLQNENIKIISHNIGGFDSRRIYFYTDTSDVFLRRIKSNLDAISISAKEKELLIELRKKSQKSGGIIYFD